MRHHCWDGQYLVYNDLSGDTHLLAEDAMKLLTLLQRDGPHPQQFLVDVAGAPLDDAPDNWALLLLDTLESICLVEQS